MLTLSLLLPFVGLIFSEEQLALFREAGLTVNVIPDAAVAAVMERVDICLVGAEAVMENGGIINKVSQNLHRFLPSLSTDHMFCC